MNNNEKPSLKSKGMSVAIVICFVVVVSVVGAVVYNSYHRRATAVSYTHLTLPTT